MANRLRELRDKAGLRQEDVAVAIGSNVDHISRLEKGKTFLKLEEATELAKVFGVRLEELLTSEPELPKTKVPLVGWLGVNGMYCPKASVGPWVGFDEVEAPFGRKDLIALRVDGESLRPVYSNGDTIFVHATERPPLEDLVGTECMVQIRGGAAYLRRIEKIAQKQLAMLVSVLGGQAETVTVEWAAPVLLVQRAPYKGGSK